MFTWLYIKTYIEEVKDILEDICYSIDIEEAFINCLMGLMVVMAALPLALIPISVDILLAPGEIIMGIIYLTQKRKESENK